MKKHSEICVIGTNEKLAVLRNELIFQGLEELGVKISKIFSPSFRSRTALQKSDNEQLFRYHLKFWLGLIPKVFLENLILFFVTLYNINKIRKSRVLYIQSYGNYVVPVVKFYSIIFNKPVILDAHGSLYYQRIVGCGDYPVNSFYAKIIFSIDKISALLVDQYITLSENYAKKLSESFKRPNSKFLSIYIGSIKNMVTEDCYTREHTPLEFDIAQFSSFKDFHGGENIIHMVDFLVKSKKYTDIKVLLSGTGPLLSHCEKLTNELGLRKNIYFNHYKRGDENLFKMIFSSKIIMGPMGDSELNKIDFSTKMCEALAFGKTLVTIDSPSARELLEDGKNAILVDREKIEESSEKILYTLQDEEKRKKIENEAFNTYLKNLTPKIIALRLMDKIDTL